MKLLQTLTFLLFIRRMTEFVINAASLDLILVDAVEAMLKRT